MNSDNLSKAIALMERVEKRVVPNANPCPSNLEWRELKNLLATLDNPDEN